MQNTTETNTYYNAKPSNITNLGKDVSGAKRMNFDTYETSMKDDLARYFLTFIRKCVVTYLRTNALKE